MQFIEQVNTAVTIITSVAEDPELSATISKSCLWFSVVSRRTPEPHIQTADGSIQISCSPFCRPTYHSTLCSFFN
jgi:hypothetical protein